MRIGSLFSGYRGLDMAAEQFFGARTVWWSDIDPGAILINSHHWPDQPNLGDITAVDWTRVEPVDIVTGGFPCQDVSFAGKRAGLRPGTRSGLWGEFVRCIVGLRPRHVVIENVLGLMSGEWTDEPNDRCLCGWAYRRRGLHRDPDQAQQVGNGVLGGDLGGHDRSGADRSRSPEEPLRGMRGPASEADRSVGVCVEVGDPRHGGGAVPRFDQGTSDSQGGAGADSSAGRGGQGGAASTEERPRLLDGAGAIPLCGTDEAASRVECEGTDDTNIGLLCPACGRDLGDGSTRTVFRSGVSVVLGDLASLGYVGSWRCLRAADVGAPHGRARIFICATDTDAAEQRRGAARRDHRVRTEGLVSVAAAADAERGGRDGRPGQLGQGRRAEPEDGDRAPADTNGAGLQGSQRAEPQHPRPPVDLGAPATCHYCGEPATAGQDCDNCGARIVADPTGDGRHEGWPEPARLVGGPDATQRGAGVIANAEGDPWRLSDRDGGTATDPEGSDAGQLGGNGRGRTARKEAGRRPNEPWRGQLGSAHDQLPSAAEINWGAYAPAIERWARVLGRPAPAPTETSQRGSQRLSPAFVEWMMGLPNGHVTAVPGLSRNAQLKALGNGVVPQQAYAALSLMAGQLEQVAS